MDNFDLKKYLAEGRLLENKEVMSKIRDLLNQAVDLGDKIDLDKFKSEGGVGYKDATLIIALKNLQRIDKEKWHDRIKK